MIDFFYIIIILDAWIAFFYCKRWIDNNEKKIRYERIFQKTNRSIAPTP